MSRNCSFIKVFPYTNLMVKKNVGYNSIGVDTSLLWRVFLRIGVSQKVGRNRYSMHHLSKRSQQIKFGDILEG